MIKLFNKIIYIFKIIIWIILLKHNTLQDLFILLEKYEEKINKSKKENFNKSKFELVEKILFNYIKRNLIACIARNDFYTALKTCKYIYNTYPDIIFIDESYLTIRIGCLERISMSDLKSIYSQELLQIENIEKRNQILGEIYYKRENYEKALYYYKLFIEKSKLENLNIFDYYFIGICCFHILKITYNMDYLRERLFYIQKGLEIYPESRLLLKHAMLDAYTLKDFALAKKYTDINYKLGYIDKNFQLNVYAGKYHKVKEKWRKLLFKSNTTDIFKHEWSGKENISNKTILIVSIYGCGDNILSYGYVLRLTKLAKEVKFLVENSLYELFKNNTYGVKVYSKNETAIHNIEYDYGILSCYLPEALNLTEENISVEGGYIKADENLCRQYKEKYFNTDKFKIGIAFKGFAGTKNPLRDIPLETLQLLDKLDNVQFYCLTKDINDNELEIFKRNRIINLAKEFSSFADTAAAIENTDIIVTSDNCILHLAGAVGKRTIALFDYYFVNAWYNLSGEDCGYYKNVKPIVNDINNNWNISMQKAIEIIRNIMDK